MRPLRAVIDLDAIAHNLAVAKRLSGNARVAAAVKANAYGHGAVEILPAVVEADWLAVASIDEALDLREAGATQPVLLLEGVFSSGEYEQCAVHGFEPVIHHLWQAELLQREPPVEPLSIWLKIDSGMSRLGLGEWEFRRVYEALQCRPNLANSLSIMTHFASADEESDLTERQWQHFCDLTRGHEGAKSAANSAAVLFHPTTHADIVRPGLMLYGAGPDSQRHGATLGLRPAMRLETEIIALRKVAAGETVGYGQSWIAPRVSLIATAAVGYGDGYPRALSNRGEVLINDKRAPLAGRVSMDMIGIDVTDIQASIGDKVILWGEGLPIEKVAKHAGTIAYELMTGIMPRVRKSYTGGKREKRRSPDR